MTFLASLHPMRHLWNRATDIRDICGYQERQAIKMLTPEYEKRRAALKTIPRFWPVTLMHSRTFQMHVQHHADQQAFEYLEDVWLVRDPMESRVFTLEMVSDPQFCASFLFRILHVLESSL